MTITPVAPTAEPELITLQEFSRRFAIPKSSWYRLVEAGNAPPILKVGKRTLVPLREAREWVAGRLRPASTISRAQHQPR